jgi:hypothetical protein
MQRLFTISLGLTLVLLSACSLQPLAPKAIEVISQPPIEKRETIAPPLIEKRETLTATGYAVISIQNHRVAAQQRLLAIRAAKLDAYRSLTEQVYGLRLNATATVADMVVQNDTFRSRVEGVIYGATLVSITPSGDDTYETTLSLDKDVVQELRQLYLGQLLAKSK